MSGLEAISTRHPANAKASGSEFGVVAYTAPANHRVHVFFDFDVDGSAGGNKVLFEIWRSTSISAGSGWTRTKVNESDPEALQGTAQTYAAAPTTAGDKRIGIVAVGTLNNISSRVYAVKGGETIYVKPICATDPTAVGIVLNTNE